MKNECSGRGCVIILLPCDGEFKPVYMENISKRNDIQKILSSSSIFMDKMEKKRKSLEKSFS